MKKLVIVIICLLALVGLVQLFMPGLAWDGGASAQIDVQVIDAASGAGISDVAVSLIYRGIPKKRAKTDADGEALFRETFPAGGTSIMLYSATTLSTREYSLRLERPGYINVEIPLAADGRVRGRRIRCKVELRRPDISREPTASGVPDPRSAGTHHAGIAPGPRASPS